jgi:hypothetical protein
VPEILVRLQALPQRVPRWPQVRQREWRMAPEF